MRTIIYYGGEEYIAGMNLEEVKAAIDAILATGEAGWLPVNHGRGKLRAAELLIAPGATIGLIDASGRDEAE